MMVAAVSVAAQTPSGDAPRPRYAVASALADIVTVTYAQDQTGSTTDRNRRDRIDMPKNALDGPIASDVAAMVQQACGDCPVSVMQVDAALLADAKEGSVPAWLFEGARQSGMQYLVLLTKHRAAARLQFANTVSGQGNLSGLGFYLDPVLDVIDPKTQAISHGYFAPYAYFRVQVIDLAAGTLLLNQPIRASATMGVQHSPDGSLWNGVSSEQKVGALLALVREETAKVLPTSIARPAAK